MPSLTRPFRPKSIATIGRADTGAATGEVPILGPVSGSDINAPDGAQVNEGVAILSQSAGIAQTLTHQTRALPIAYMVACDTQAQTGWATIAETLLDDEKVTALGLYLEEIGDLRAFEALAAKSQALGKPILALKVAPKGDIRETGAAALLARLGIARVFDLPSLLEGLKLLHVFGTLRSGPVVAVGCAAGEACLMSDAAARAGLELAGLSERQQQTWRAVFGDGITPAIPPVLSRQMQQDASTMRRALEALADPDLALVLLVVDGSHLKWEALAEAALAARGQTGQRYALLVTLPEQMPEDIAARLISGGVLPLMGLREAMAALICARQVQAGTQSETPPPLLLPSAAHPDPDLVPRAEAKAWLARFGLRVPRCKPARSVVAARAVAADIGYPVVLKAAGALQNANGGAVRLNLSSGQEVSDAAVVMPSDRFVVEEMICGAVAELRITVQKDPAHGFVMTLAAGGALSDILQDSASVLLPATDQMLREALDALRITACLAGYRGAPAADRPAILRAIRAIESYVLAEAEGLDKVEVNPLLCTPQDAIAVDAVMYRKDVLRSINDA